MSLRTKAVKDLREWLAITAPDDEKEIAQINGWISGIAFAVEEILAESQQTDSGQLEVDLRNMVRYWAKQ